MLAQFPRACSRISIETNEAAVAAKIISTINASTFAAVAAVVLTIPVVVNGITFAITYKSYPPFGAVPAEVMIAVRKMEQKEAEYMTLEHFSPYTQCPQK